jgi:hypothetical protein
LRSFSATSIASNRLIGSLTALEQGRKQRILIAGIQRRP